MQPKTLDELLTANGVTLTAQHVPSTYDPKTREGMITWRVTLQKSGQQFTTDYRQGIEHLPCYKSSKSLTVYDLEVINACLKSGRVRPLGPKLTPPSVEDVVVALCTDTEALEMTFAQFCDSFGYDTDSRKAETIYNACRENGLGLLRVLGPQLLAEVRPPYCGLITQQTNA